MLDPLRKPVLHLGGLCLFSPCLLLGCGAGPPGAGGCPDEDGDGHEDAVCGGDDCDDQDASIHPGARDNIDPGEWALEVVDAADMMGSASSLMADATGTLHVSYWDPDGEDLRYATNQDGQWRSEVVESDGNLGRSSCVALDRDGRVHIVYEREWPTAEVGHATKVGGRWEVETVASDVSCRTCAGVIQMRPSLAVGPEGRLHVSYTTFVGDKDGDLRYATNDSGAWESETVDAEGDTGRKSSVAVDGSGAVHLAYSGGGRVRYASNADAAWEIQELSSPLGGTRSNRALAVDASGTPHVTYQCHMDWGGENPVADLCYSTVRDGAWVAETVATGGFTGTEPSLVVGARGAVHIVFEDEARQELRTGTKEAAGWTTSTVLHGALRTHPTLALDPDGGIHIASSMAGNGSLGHATNRALGTDGVDQNCDGVDGVDADGDGHASWRTGGDDPDDADPSLP